MTVYYNEFDPYAAQWLRNLIAAGHIAPGVVDERSITEVQPDELKGYTQCHFFAGIGVWSHALRSAGWDDSRPVWTGSCPCQPFSSAGKRLGTADERHLWPAFAKLIAECKPPAVFGEQVASGAGRDWLASVRTDLEGMGYAVGAADLCAAGTGAPHIRQRLYWVADADGGRQQGNGQQHGGTQRPEQQAPQRLDAGGCGEGGGLADASEVGWGNQRAAGNLDSSEGQESSRRDQSALPSDHSGANDGLADTDNARQQGDGLQPLQRGRAGDGEVAGAAGLGAVGGLADTTSSGLTGTSGSGSAQELGAAERSMSCGMANSAGGLVPQPRGRAQGRDGARPDGADDAASARGASTPNGFWSAPDWLWCRDGKWRPVESGTEPLATGAAARVGRLRAYGNALCAPVAEAFIRAYLTE